MFCVVPTTLLQATDPLEWSCDIKDIISKRLHKDASILDKEEQWYRHGIKEAIWEQVEEPSLSKKGGLHYNLSHAWNQAIKLIPGHLSHYNSSGSVT